MLEVCRNRRRMKQRADLGAAKFFWPKIAEMIEWKLNWHTVVLARSVGWIERSALDVSYEATFIWHRPRSGRSHLRPKSARITNVVTAAQHSANHSP